MDSVTVVRFHTKKTPNIKKGHPVLRSFWGHFGVILGSPDELEIAPLLDRKVESDRHCDHLRSFGGVGAIPG